jgi:DNA-binding IscR family transcriptional regulator
MSRDSRLSGILHVLLHMAESGGPVTSKDLARAMRTNPVVVRRTLAGLRERGLVRADKGHGGGWVIGRGLSDITLADVFEALGGPSLFAIGHRDADPACLVEQAVNAALEGVLQEARGLLLARFGQVTLQALSTDFHARLTASSRAFDPETAHAS